MAGLVDAVIMARRVRPARERIQRAGEFINRELPELRRSILAAADNAVQGRMIMPGNSELTFVGDPPDWFTPRYNDNEYLAKLNRHLHWKPLLEAHVLTGDDTYAAKVVGELDDWLKRVEPLPFLTSDGRPNARGLLEMDVPPWGALELAIRLYDTWPLLIELLAGGKHLPPARMQAMAQSMALQASYLSRLSPLLWPAADHNHYFMEMLGVLSTAVLFPELPEAEQWQTQGVEELIRCVDAQFSADGGHLEGCPNYHNDCMELLARFLRLAQAADRPLPARVHALGDRAAAYALHSTRPVGCVVPWGDTVPNQKQVDGVIWSCLISGNLDVPRELVVLMGLERVKAHCEKSVWWLDDPEAFWRAVSTKTTSVPLVRHDRGNDQVMMRSAWNKAALSVFFTCHSPLHPGSAHQHIDLGGFDFCAHGRVLVADPGPFTYRECEDRRLFKSAAYHSVVTINERDHFEYLSRWRYGPQPEGRVTSVREEEGIVWLDSFHRSYAPAVCHRTLALVGGRILVVLDRVEDIAPASTWQIYFHLDARQAAWDETSRRVQSDHDGVQLTMLSSGGLDCAFLPGRISGNWDVTRPSTRVCFSDRGGAGRRVHATVLVPSPAGGLAPVVDRLHLAPDGQCSLVCDGREYRIDRAR